MTINFDVLIPEGIAALGKDGMAIFNTLIRQNVPQRIGIRNPKKPEKWKFIMTLTIDDWGKYREII